MRCTIEKRSRLSDARGAVAAILLAATMAAFPHPQAAASAASPPRADTLGNGISRAFVLKLAPWVKVWRHAIPTFSLGSLVLGPSSPLDFDYAWPGLAARARDMGDRTFDAWSPDSTHYVNIDMSAGIVRDDNGVPHLEYDADAQPVLADFKSDTLWRVAFCGPGCRYDGAYWADSRRFALTSYAGAGPRPGRWRARLDIYDLRTRAFRRWLGPPVSDLQFRRFKSASDSALIARHR